MKTDTIYTVFIIFQWEILLHTANEKIKKNVFLLKVLSDHI